MTTFIDQHDVGNGVITETSPHAFLTEASSLGLPPGTWPTSIATNMGNQQPFVSHRTLEDGGRVYRQSLGCIELHVIND